VQPHNTQKIRKSVVIRHKTYRKIREIRE